MRRPPPRQRALIPLIFGAILVVWIAGRIWIDRPRGESRATEASLIPTPASPAAAAGR